MSPSSNYADLMNYVGTPQTKPLSPQTAIEVLAKQERNNAGGFVFSLDKWKRLDRFLILGSDSNTYYQKAPALTKENASCVIDCWSEDALKTARTIGDISIAGRAPKNSPAIFAVALGCIHADEAVRKGAYLTIPKVCRTSTHFFELVSTCKKLGKGFGRGFKRAIADWYNVKSDDQLAYQLIKYRSRFDYTHERLIRLSHPKQEHTSEARRVMYDWLRGREVKNFSALPNGLKGHIWAMATENTLAGDWMEILDLIRVFNLPWEALPTWANSKPEVWETMLPRIPLTALIRNLGNMTRLGVFKEANVYDVVDILTDDRKLDHARIHPFNVLNALHTYKSGKGFRGSHSWTPISLIERALETCFYKSFMFVPTTNKRILIGLDVSSSMTGATLFNSALTAREASAAMAMATMRAEPNVGVVGFTSLSGHNTGMAVSPLNIHRNMKLDEVIRNISDLPHAGTDCSLPMLYAMQQKLNIDAFVIYTDNETYAGRIHPSEALNRYRRESGIDAKLIVVGMTSTGFSIADPNDPGMLDIVGFDSSAPAIISSFLHDKHALLEDNISATLDDEGSEDQE